MALKNNFCGATNRNDGKNLVVSSNKESRNSKPTYGYNIMLTNQSLSSNLYKVHSINNKFMILTWGTI